MLVEEGEEESEGKKSSCCIKCVFEWRAAFFVERYGHLYLEFNMAEGKTVGPQSNPAALV